MSGLLIVTASPTAQADTRTSHATARPKTPYSLSYGRGEYSLKGNIIWHNRTVQIGAALRADEADCAKARYKFWHGRKLVRQVERVVCARTKDTASCSSTTGAAA